MSDKALFVMDMPESCFDCVFCFEIDEGTEAYCTVTDEQGHKGLLREIKEDYCQCKPDWCPLKPVPEKMDCPPMNGENYEAGWNACIDEIAGGAEWVD